MLRIYKNVSGRILEQDEISNGCWVHLSAPDNGEIKSVCKQLSVPESFVRAALDEEERSRIDEEEGTLLIVVDTPTAEQDNNDFYYSTIPFGIIVTENAVLTVCAKETALPSSAELTFPVILDCANSNPDVSTASASRNNFLIVNELVKK